MTAKMALADEIICRATMGSFSAVDRRLRDLATEYKLRRHANFAYEYRDGEYHFRKGFRSFLRQWIREHQN